MQEFELIKKLLAEAEEDVARAEGGNRAAGTRVRKKMQEIKAAAQAVRQRILESRDLGSAAPEPPKPPAQS